MDNKIIVMKMIDGEVVIGKVISSDSKSITLDHALCMGHRVADDYIPIVYFYKYCLYNESYVVTIDRSHIINVFDDVMKYIVRQYEMAVAKYKLFDSEASEADNSQETLGDNIYSIFRPKDKDNGGLH